MNGGGGGEGGGTVKAQIALSAILQQTASRSWWRIKLLGGRGGDNSLKVHTDSHTHTHYTHAGVTSMHVWGKTWALHYWGYLEALGANASVRMFGFSRFVWKDAPTSYQRLTERKTLKELGCSLQLQRAKTKILISSTLHCTRTAVGEQMWAGRCSGGGRKAAAPWTLWGSEGWRSEVQ